MGLFRWRSRRSSGNPEVSRLAAGLTEQPVELPEDVFERCRALERLAELGPDAAAALPAILSQLWVPVRVDCRIALRFASAEAALKVGGLSDLALPILAWSLKDRQWGTARKAVRLFREMALSAHSVTPDLIQLADRLLDPNHQPFDRGFEREERPLLAEVAEALGECGRGPCWRDAFACLTRIKAGPNPTVRDAAESALAELGDPADGVREGKPVLYSNPFGWGPS